MTLINKKILKITFNKKNVPAMFKNFELSGYYIIYNFSFTHFIIIRHDNEYVYIFSYFHIFLHGLEKFSMCLYENCD